MRIYNRNTGRSLPSHLSMYQGGLYVGNFFPGPPVNNIGSDVLGNKQTGTAKIYNTQISSPGDSSNSWGIILDTADYIPSTNSSFKSVIDSISNSSSSSHDGLYNKQNSVTTFYKTLKNKNIRGYSDWYVPSVDELAFIAKNLPIGFYIPRRFTGMSPKIYRSSSISIKGDRNSNINFVKTHSYYYGQSFDKTKYGTVVNVDEFSVETSVRLIRRINLILI